MTNSTTYNRAIAITHPIQVRHAAKIALIQQFHFYLATNEALVWMLERAGINQPQTLCKTENGVPLSSARIVSICHDIDQLAHILPDDSLEGQALETIRYSLIAELAFSIELFESFSEKLVATKCSQLTVFGKPQTRELTILQLAARSLGIEISTISLSPRETLFGRYFAQAPYISRGNLNNQFSDNKDLPPPLQTIPRNPNLTIDILIASLSDTTTGKEFSQIINSFKSRNYSMLCAVRRDTLAALPLVDDNLQYILLPDALSCSPHQAARYRELRNSLLNLLRNNHLPTEILDTCYPEVRFINLCTSAISNGEFYRELLLSHKIKAVFAPSCHTADSRAAIIAAIRSGIPVVASAVTCDQLTTATYSEKISKQIALNKFLELPHYLFGSQKIVNSFQTLYGSANTQCINAGSLMLCKEALRGAHVPSHIVRTKLKIPAHSEYILLTSQQHDFSYLFTHLLQEVVSAYSGENKYHLVIRPHPLEFRFLYLLQSFANRWKNVSVNNTIPLVDSIANARLVVTSYSVTALEAAALGKPVLLLSLFPTKINLKSGGFPGSSSIMVANSAAEAKKVLLEILDRQIEKINTPELAERKSILGSYDDAIAEAIYRSNCHANRNSRQLV